MQALIAPDAPPIGLGVIKCHGDIAMKTISATSPPSR